MEEERRRQEILENIEKTRAQRQKHKSQVQNNIQQEKEFCLAEIEKQDESPSKAKELDNDKSTQPIKLVMLTQKDLLKRNDLYLKGK